MTTSVRFYLPYGPLKVYFITFRMDNILMRQRNVATDVVNDVTSTRQSVITRVVIRFLAWAWLAKAKGHSCHTKKSTLAKIITEKNE